MASARARFSQLLRTPTQPSEPSYSRSHKPMRSGSSKTGKWRWNVRSTLLNARRSLSTVVGYRPKWTSTVRRLSCALRFVSPSSSYVPIRTCIVPVLAARDLEVSIWSRSRQPLARRLRCWASSIRQTPTRRWRKHCSSTQRNAGADALRLMVGRTASGFTAALTNDLAVEQRLVQGHQGARVVVLPIELARLGRDRFDCQDRDPCHVYLQCRQSFRNQLLL